MGAEAGAATGFLVFDRDGWRSYHRLPMALPLRYNWRNLFVRKSSTALTFGVVAAIVFVLTWSLSFAAGMQASLNAGGADDKLIVIKPGATGESTSIVTKEERDVLRQLTGLVRNQRGEILASGEMCTQVSLPRRDHPENHRTPVAIRGIGEIGFEVHSIVTVTQGRRFEPSSREIIVGAAIAERVQGLDIGDEVFLGIKGDGTFRVVGVFEAAGGPFESEIWGSVTALQDAFGRELLSSVALRIEDAGLADELIERIGEPPYQLAAKTERKYYDDIATKSAKLVYLTLVLVAFMGLGACFAVANTIYAAVDGRSREIAMLRTIGYSRSSIVVAFVMEALLVCCAGCVVGIAMTFVFRGEKQDFMAEATWSTFAVEMTVTPGILAISVGAALAVGLVGALVPAIRAARLDVITALRQA